MKKVSRLGPLIMFDGPDYVGKTTQIELAAHALRDNNHTVYVRRLVGGTDIGEALRRISFDPALRRPPLTDMYIVLAMNSALAEDLQAHRQQGAICLIDRSPLSTIAYQVFGSGMTKLEGERGVKDALKIFKPDLLLCYDAPMKVLQARRAKRTAKTKDYFGNQPLDYMERVRVGYLEAAHHYSAQMIEASGGIMDIHRVTMRYIDAIVAPSA